MRNQSIKRYRSRYTASYIRAGATPPVAVAMISTYHRYTHTHTHTQMIPENNTIPQATDSSTPLHAEIAYSVFQNYLQALNKEHTVVDSTLIQAKDALIQHANQKQEEQLTLTDFNNTEESRPNQEQVALSIGSLQDSMIQLHAKGDTTESQDKSLVTKTADDGVDGIGGCREDNGCRKFKKDHMFGEEAEEMKSAVEKYKQEQVQLEEQLLQELNQREVIRSEFI